MHSKSTFGFNIKAFINCMKDYSELQYNTVYMVYVHVLILYQLDAANGGRYITDNSYLYKFNSSDGSGVCMTMSFNAQIAVTYRYFNSSTNIITLEVCIMYDYIPASPHFKLGDN